MSILDTYAPTAENLLKLIFVEEAFLTGVAANQISGRTLHSVLEKGNTMTYQEKTGERSKWCPIKYLIIDEVSILSYENFRMIYLRLQEFENNNLLFSGINVLLFGDLNQLSSVKGHWCFEQPS